MPDQKDQLADKLRQLPYDIRVLVEKRIELFIIELGDRFSTIAARITTVIAVGLVVMLAIVFLLIGVANFVGDIFDSTSFGFVVVSTLLFVLALIVYILGPVLIGQNIKESIIQNLLDPGTTNQSTDQEEKQKNE